jgi:hypothetical protein
VEDIITSFTPSYSTYSAGGADYHTIHSIRKLLRANALSIESHLGGGARSHLGIIFLIATYATVAPAHPSVNPESLGGAPNEIDGGTSAVLLAERHHWEEAVIIFRTWTAVEQELKKISSRAFEPTYLEIINNDMVGFANTTVKDMIDHLFLSYDSITDVDLEHNWENMRKAWDPHQPVESLFKQIQDCVDYAEAGGGHHQ